MLLSVLILLTSVQSHAGPHFSMSRSDISIPSHCLDMRAKFYQRPAETLVAGRLGATQMGYTMEYPIKRENARILWRYFRDLVRGEDNFSLRKKISQDAELDRDFQIIKAHYQEMGFSFISEGEVLELLVIQALYAEFPSNHYYITGGIEYHHNQDSQTIGEVDIVVAQRDDCQSVVVGEVKLGRYMPLKKAKQQLKRFENFLIDKKASPFAGEYKPIYKTLPEAA